MVIQELAGGRETTPVYVSMIIKMSCAKLMMNQTIWTSVTARINISQQKSDKQASLLPPFAQHSIPVFLLQLKQTWFIGLMYLMWPADITESWKMFSPIRMLKDEESISQRIPFLLQVVRPMAFWQMLVCKYA